MILRDRQQGNTTDILCKPPQVADNPLDALLDKGVWD